MRYKNAKWVQRKACPPVVLIGLFPLSFVCPCSTFLITVTKCLQGSYLRDNWYPTMEGQAWQQEQEAASHFASHWRSRKWTGRGTELENVHDHSQWTYLLQQGSPAKDSTNFPNTSFVQIHDSKQEFSQSTTIAHVLNLYTLSIFE